MQTSYSERLADSLWKAVEDGDANQVQSLLDQGVNPNHEIYSREDWISKHSGRWYRRNPPLHTACSNGNLEMVKALIQRGASIGRSDKGYNMTPLHHACYVGYKPIVEYLIAEAKCDVGECIHHLPHC